MNPLPVILKQGTQQAGSKDSGTVDAVTEVSSHKETTWFWDTLHLHQLEASNGAYYFWLTVKVSIGWFKVCQFILQVCLDQPILHRKEKDEGNISSGVSGLNKTRSTLTHVLITNSAP